MSKFGSPSERKPPLYQSQYQLRSRRVLRSNASSVQTPQTSLTKSQIPSRLSTPEPSELRPEYRSMSCELQALAKMVTDEFGNGDLGKAGFVDNFDQSSSYLFERGRFYEEYSARRNERLKKKKGERGDREDEKRASSSSSSSYNLGVTVESVKRRDSKKLESSLRKTVPENFMLPNNTVNVRYSLRSNSKENKKPPLPNAMERSAAGGERKVGARKGRKNLAF